MGVAFTGGSRFAQALQALDPSKARAAVLRILRHAAEPIRERMVELAPVEPGKPDLRDSIVVSSAGLEDEDFGGRKDTGVFDVAVGPTTRAFYGHMVEFGTAPHRLKGGQHPGAPAQPFARPAFDENVDRSIQIIQEDIWDYLRKMSAGQSSSGRGL
jgi:HK97 gp10 family phage protein